MESDYSIFKDIDISHDLLFHYTTTEKALEEILPHGRLQLTPLIDMNDPLEYKKQPFFFWGDAVTEDVPNIQRELHDAIRVKSKAVCFTLDSPNNKPKDATGRGFAKARMWSQYADGHKGVCLTFYKSKIDSIISETFNYGSRLFKGEIKYGDFFNEISNAYEISELEIKEKGIKEFIKDHVKKYRSMFFFRKLTDYKDELEYRYVIYNENKGIEYINIGNALCGIIVGDRFPRVYECSVQNYADRLYKGRVQCERLDWYTKGNPFLRRLIYI